jgi:hypothetical protein
VEAICDKCDNCDLRTNRPAAENTSLPAVFVSAPSGFRTPDPLIKSQLLYQLS